EVEACGAGFGQERGGGMSGRSSLPISISPIPTFISISSACSTGGGADGADASRCETDGAWVVSLGGRAAAGALRDTTARCVLRTSPIVMRVYVHSIPSLLYLICI